jgi:ATP/maltotriose-dependent transcriptional regulator MalT
VPGAATDPRLGLAQIEVIRGAYPAALTLAEAALPAAVAGGHLHNQQSAWELLARTAMHLGRIDEAQRHAEQSHALAEASGDRWALAHALHMLGNLADIRRDYASARAHFEAGLAILEELDDPGRAGAVRNKLGLVALHQGQPAAAQRHFQHSRAVLEQNGDRSGLLAALEGLGNAAAAQGDFATARERFREALRQLRAAATDGAYGIYLASLLASIGELACRAGEPGRGRELLGLAARHPAATQYMRERTQHLLGEPPSGDPRLPFPDDQAVVTLTLEVLAALETTAASVPEAQGLAPGGAPLQPLVEPLSPRELEVLRLLAAGLSNQEIAGRLIVAVGTVKTHVHNVCGKLGAPNRGRAVALARELGLL